MSNVILTWCNRHNITQTVGSRVNELIMSQCIATPLLRSARYTNCDKNKNSVFLEYQFHMNLW